MAIRWLGRALAVAKIATHTVGGTPAISQVYTVTRNGKSISYTASGVDTNITIATALQALLAASTITEFAEVTWSVNSAIITSTCDTAGVDITFTTSATGTGTFVTATTTAASGPNHWNAAVNWSGGAVPVNGDDVIIDLPISILWGLDQSAVTLTSLTIAASFSLAAEIGLARENASGYTEDRDDYLKIGATACTIGVGEGQGSGRIKIDFGSAQTACEVRKSRNPAEQGIPAILLKGTHASNALDVQSGTVGVGINGEASTLLTLRVASNASVTCGAGCTLGTVSGDGTVQLNSSVTTMTQAGGNWTINGASAVTTLTQNGGALNYNSSGTTTTGVIGGQLNFSGDASARTFTALTLSKGGKIFDPNNTLTVTGGILKAANVREITAA